MLPDSDLIDVCLEHFFFQVVFDRADEIRQRGLAQHFQKLCDIKNPYAGGQPCTEVFHSLEFNQQG